MTDLPSHIVGLDSPEPDVDDSNPVSVQQQSRPAAGTMRSSTSNTSLLTEFVLNPGGLPSILSEARNPSSQTPSTPRSQAQNAEG